MNAAIIATGSELISGLVQDSNSKFLAENLSSYGIKVNNIYICGDEKENIKETIKTAEKNAELIFITGGLGPTKDDQSKEAFAEAFNLKLNYVKEIEDKLKDFFCNHNSKMTSNNLSQAYIPQGAEIINNEKGTAPALKIKLKDKIFYLLPGVPPELKYIFNNKIADDLEKLNDQKIIIKEFNFIGIGESTLADKIENLDFAEEIEVSYQAGKAEVKLRLKINGDLDRNKIKKLNFLEQAERKIEVELGDYIYSKDNKDILDMLYSALIKNELTISTAESFTGGLLAERLTEKAGSSNYFRGAVIAYNSEIKKQLLNVEQQIIAEHGVVSKECVLAMAENCAEIFNSEIAVATTGAAGPDGHNGKKAGIMHLAIYFKGQLKHFKLEKNYGRSLNRFYASQIAFFELLKLIKKSRR